MNSHEVFIHIHQGCYAGTGAIVRLPQCQWSKPDGYGKISQCITTTKQKPCAYFLRYTVVHVQDSKVHGANMGTTGVLSTPDGPHVGPLNLAIRVSIFSSAHTDEEQTSCYIFCCKCTGEIDWWNSQYQSQLSSHLSWGLLFEILEFSRQKDRCVPDRGNTTSFKRLPQGQAL